MSVSIRAAALSDSLDDLFRQPVASHAEPFWPVVDEPAYLFRYDDRPLMAAPGAYRCDEGAN